MKAGVWRGRIIVIIVTAQATENETFSADRPHAGVVGNDDKKGDGQRRSVFRHRRRL